ncbi:MAG: amino acid ABC transporter substrate-binding protein [Betaproteobacteria bacterium]|jgi:ABC-type amino acid transport substrate-binding protein|nr:amino acid ABC transporter substrate-binding protein [Betaproteobacteria bacterium]MBK7080167.1 amino acid ABC transporter substrate-binding protein [Betaproteobacteria bacterium]MBK7591073.1 amino acid ABC transporter substrate-binding protein [Betaproteobacteria bacterium]MBK7743168.1 amino acid ABC transporter substrate-binding protein [Betaproteobacteria bacterium]MBK8687849.1 amino acid ABC transporter substrate-binding protein [Betaproteobacteria bacterium]
MNCRPLFGLAVAAALVVLGAAPAGAAAPSPTLDRIKEARAITLGYRSDAAPFSFKDRDGRVLGYSVELCARVATAVQKDLGLAEMKVLWQPLDAADRIAAVASGRVDVECGTTTATLTRMKAVDFSLPIFVDGGSVLVRAKAKLKRLADLKGKRIGAIGGTTTEEAIVRMMNSLGGTAVMVPVKDGAEGMQQLARGAVDAYAADRVVLARLRQRQPKPSEFEFIAGDFSFEPYALVMSRDDPELRLIVNRTLAGLYRSGEIDPIFQRWLGSLGRPGPLLHSMYYLNTLPE